mmetsp:Transcript_2769/g.7009  ORF Transcript_2769/g.7009 Transcript_2769/m.7009 type:complete len:250 (+) Transcript_2769:1250-1999(+)
MFFLEYGQIIEKLLQPGGMDRPLVGKVPSPLRQQINIIIQHQTQSSIINLQMRHVRQKIIPHEHAHEDEIVDDPAHVVLHAQPALVGELPELYLEHLAKRRDLQQLEVVPRVIQHVLLLAVFVPAAPRHDHGHLLTQEEEVGLVRGEAEHDEVGVEAVEDVCEAGGPVGVRGGGVFWVVQRLRFANVVHHLMLALSGHVGSANDDVAAVLPNRIRLLLVLDPLSHGQTQLEHEVRSGRDAIGIECSVFG